MTPDPIRPADDELVLLSWIRREGFLTPAHLFLEIGSRFAPLLAEIRADYRIESAYPRRESLSLQLDVFARAEDCDPILRHVDRALGVLAYRVDAFPRGQIPHLFTESAEPYRVGADLMGRVAMEIVGSAARMDGGALAALSPWSRDQENDSGEVGGMLRRYSRTYQRLGDPSPFWILYHRGAVNGPSERCGDLLARLLTGHPVPETLRIPSRSVSRDG